MIHLYTIEQSGALYRTDLNNGKWRQLGKPEFANTRFLFADRQNLYTIETDGSLYRVSPSDGTWSRMGQAGDWKDTIMGTTANGAIYSVERNGGLYVTNPITGLWKQIGKADFGRVQFIFGVGGSIYSIEDGALYLINTTTGNRTTVGKTIRQSTAAIQNRER